MDIITQNNAEISPEIAKQRFYFAQIPALVEFLNTVPSFFLVLNDHREIIYANHAFLKFIKPENKFAVIGKKPGDALNCINSKETPEGCGASEVCKTCGALDVINRALLNGERADNECNIKDIWGNSFDFKVWSSPYMVGNETFTLFSIADISDQKRREILERAFFHDIMNSIGGLKGFAELLSEFPEEATEYKDIILLLTERIIDEINSHKLLITAEQGELKIEPLYVSTVQFMAELVNFFKMHNVAIGKEIILDRRSVAGVLFTDSTILRRVMINMLKNALEATDIGGIVSLGVDKTENGFSFWVHNDSVLSSLVRLQIFKRSFSTKGAGRGIGTYSMKLFGEQYLKGKVGFETSSELGTKFYLDLPESILSET